MFISCQIYFSINFDPLDMEGLVHMATHGMLSSDYWQRCTGSGILPIILTDTDTDRMFDMFC